MVLEFQDLISYEVIDVPLLDNQFPLYIDIIICKCSLSHTRFYIGIIYISPNISAATYERFLNVLSLNTF